MRRLPWGLRGPQQRTQVGVALGPDRLTTVVLNPRGGAATRETCSRPLETMADLGAAFEELRALLGVAQGTLRIALLPPLVQAKRVELPRLRPDELHRVLTRDAGRYFVGAEGARVVGVARPARRRPSPVPYLVASAEASLIDAIYQAAASSGWMVESIVPAYAAWAAAARQRWPELRRQDGRVVVVMPDRVDALHLERGRLVLIRRFRPGALEAASDTLAIDDPALVAARFAAHTAGLELVPERVRVERERRSAQRSARLLAATAALLVLSAGVELWGAHRELDALRTHRAAVRARVAEAMQVRDQLDGLDARLHALAGAERGASRWTTALTRLAEHLPRDAHLLSFRGEVDSFAVEGVARQAAPAFEALGKAPEMLSVRATAPIRQEARDSAPPIERFTLMARLAPPPAMGPEP